MRSIRSQTMTLAAVLLLGPGIAVSAQAQSVITGRVTSEQGVTLQGANVFITELQISVGTNANGVYTITVPQARVSGQTVQLRARSVGFVPTARPITLSTGSQTVNFELKNDVLRLSEIVVTGVTEGTERAKVPFAIGRVTEKDLPVPALDPIRALAGKVAGLRIAQTSGRPGSTPEIMLRGPTSINAAGRGQGPLIIVDGAILNNGSLQEIGGLDIESVEVVKGAAGASLYGTRAAAGVITITTKRGNNASDGVKFDVRSEDGISDLNSIRYGMPLNHQLQLDETGTRFCVAGTSNIAACSRTVEWGKEIARINNVAADTTRTPQALQGNNVAVGDGTLQNLYQAAIWPGQYYNPLAQVLQRNLVTLNSLNATGKVAGVRFYASGQYQDDQGAIRGLNGNQQRRARVNLDYDPRKDLTVSLSSLYNRGTNDTRSGGSSNGGILGQVLRGVAIGTDFAARDTLGRYYVRSGGAFLRSPTGNGGGTILYDSENLSSTTESDRFLGSITTRYNPLTWFGLEGTFAYDDRSSENKNYLVKGYRTFAISTSSNNGQVNFSNNRETSMNGSMQATFRKQLLSDLSSKLTFRGQFDDYEGFSNGSGAEVLTVANIYTTSNSTQNRYATSSSSQIKNVGYVGALNLDYKDRYTLEGYLRRDGSSLFGQQQSLRDVWPRLGRLAVLERAVLQRRLHRRRASPRVVRHGRQPAALLGAVRGLQHQLGGRHLARAGRQLAPQARGDGGGRGRSRLHAVQSPRRRAHARARRDEESDPSGHDAGVARLHDPVAERRDAAEPYVRGRAEPADRAEAGLELERARDVGPHAHLHHRTVHAGVLQRRRHRPGHGHGVPLHGAHRQEQRLPGQPPRQHLGPQVLQDVR